MTTSNNAAPIVGKQSNLQIAKLNEVTNVHDIESKLSDYAGNNDGLPVTVSFHQEFKKKETIAVVIEEDEVKTEKKIVDGIEKDIPVLEPIEKTLHNGKKITVWQPVKTGKKLQKKSRIETGDFLNDMRNYKVRFICKDAKELRQEIGEAFTEFYGCLASGEVNFAKSQKIQITFNFNGKVLSTKYLSYGGVKMSKIYKKGILQRDLYSSEFCKPLFNQLKDVASGENNKPLEIPTEILEAIGLREKK